MARRPVPIFVVPKSGVTVRLDGVVVPAEGLETTVDDELANEVLEGTLDCGEVPYHAPPLSGAAAGQLGGLTGSATGAMQLAGSTPTPLLSLVSNQPPSTIAMPSFMQTGRWRFSFKQTSDPGTQQSLFNRGGFSQDDLFIGGFPSAGAPGTNIQLYAGAAFVTSRSITYSFGQSVTVTVDWLAGQLTVSGATTGNGTSTFAAATYSWSSGTMGVGRLSTSAGLADFAGTLSDVVDLDAPTLGGLTGSAAGTVTTLTPISGTAAGTQGGLVGLAGGTSSTSIAGTGAGAQGGLAGAAAGAMQIAGTGAGVFNSAGTYTLGLDLSASQPATLLGAAPSFMLSGAWRFTFTQTSEGASLSGTLFGFAGGALTANQVYCSNTLGRIYVAVGGVFTFRSCTWSFGQPVTLTFNTAAATLTIAGATTGNGTFSINSGTPWSWSAGALGVGQYAGTTPVGNRFVGSFSNVEQALPTGAWLVGAAAGALRIAGTAAGAQSGLTGAATGAERIAGTAAGSQAGLVGAATSLPDPGVGNALLVDSSGNYLLNAAGDYLYGRQ